MKKICGIWVAILMVVAMGFGNAAWVHAQENDEDAFTLEEITVTAQKRQENSQKVSLAMETISGEELQKYGKVDFSDAFSSVAALIVQPGERGFEISMRGMSNDFGGLDATVAVNFDGEYGKRGEMGIAGLYDMDRVEVLMGPQGTLYGRLSTGGVVNMISKNPTDKLEASATFESGNYALLHADAMVNVPINSKWALRAAFSSVVRDGYLDNGLNDNDAKAGRFKVKFSPKDNVDLVLTTEHIRTGGQGSSFVDPFVDQPDDPWEGQYKGSERLYRDTETKRYSLDLNVDLGFGELTFHPSLRKFNSDMGRVLMGNYQQRYEDNEELATELRLASSADNDIQWLAGLYYYSRDEFMHDLDEAPTHADYWFDDKSSTSKAAFGNLSYPVTNRFRLIGGVRYTTDEEDSEGMRRGSSRVSDKEYSNTDYRFAIEYDLSEDSMLWADYSTGFRAGKGDNEPEYVYAYQLGVKNRFFDNRLQLNATAYFYDYDGYQAEQWNVDSATGDMEAAMGNGMAEIKGVDLDIEYVLTERDRFTASIAYLDATFSDLVMRFETMDDVYYTGDVMTHSPEWTIVPNYEHAFYLPNGATLTANVNTRYQTKSSICFALEAQYNYPDEIRWNEAHFISNASLTYLSPENRWSVNAYIKNIENFAEKAGMMGGTMTIRAPRTFAVILSTRF